MDFILVIVGFIIFCGLTGYLIARYYRNEFSLKSDIGSIIIWLFVFVVMLKIILT